MKCTRTFLFAALAFFIGAIEAVNDLLPPTTAGGSYISLTTGATDTGRDSSLTLPIIRSTSITTPASVLAMPTVTASSPQPHMLQGLAAST